MKNKLFSLIKINIINSFKLNNLKNKTISKKILITLGIIYLFGVVLFTFGFYSYSLFDTLNKANLSSLYIPIIFILGILIAFIMLIHNAKAILFENKDNDLLLSLPIKKQTVLFARFLSVMLYSFVIIFFITLPGIAIYISYINPGIIFYISILFLLICIPVIPTILSSLIGYLLAFISSKTNLKGTFEIIYYLLVMGIYFYAMTNINTLLSKIINNPQALEQIMKYALLPIYLINKLFTTNNIIYLLYFILLSIITTIIFIYLLKSTYFKIISNLNNIKTKKDYKLKNNNSSSISNSLFKKEIKRYISSPIYLFNTAFGILILIIASIASFKYSSKELSAFMDLGTNLKPLLLVFIIITFVLSMTNSACCSISIERNNFWILKSSPIPIKKIFDSKLKINYLIAIPVTIISLVLFTLSGYINIIELILLSIYAISINVSISHFGLLVNLKFPNMTSNNDVEVVKRSTSVLVGTIVPMFTLVILYIIILSLNLKTTTVLYTSIIIWILLAIFLRTILNKWGINKFKTIN